MHKADWRDTFEETYRAHASRINAIARKFARSDTALAEELAQEAWLSLWLANPASVNPEKLDAWIGQVARNRMLSVLRSHHPLTPNTGGYNDDASVLWPEDEGDAE
jgi:RNA polymerase sigma factor (sigma-70 family)